MTHPGCLDLKREKDALPGCLVQNYHLSAFQTCTLQVKVRVI